MIKPIAVSDIEGTITPYFLEPENPNRINVEFLGKIYYMDDEYERLLEKEKENTGADKIWDEIIYPEFIGSSGKEKVDIASEICYNYLISNLDPAFYDFRSIIYGYGGAIHMASFLPCNIVERFRNEFELGESCGVYYYTENDEIMGIYYTGEHNLPKNRAEFKEDFVKKLKREYSDAYFFGFGDDEKYDTHMPLCDKQFWVDNNSLIDNFGTKVDEMKSILKEMGLKFRPKNFRKIPFPEVFNIKKEVSEKRFDNFRYIYSDEWDWKGYKSVWRTLNIEKEIIEHIGSLGSQDMKYEFIEDTISDKSTIVKKIYERINFEISLDDLVTYYGTC